MWVQAYNFRHKQDYGVTLMRNAILKNTFDQFELASLVGIYLHEEEIVVVSEPIELINQLSYTPITSKTVSLQVKKGFLYVCEWRCNLFDDIFLEHTVNKVSQFSPH